MSAKHQQRNLGGYRTWRLATAFFGSAAGIVVYDALCLARSKGDVSPLEVYLIPSIIIGTSIIVAYGRVIWHWWHR